MKKKGLADVTIRGRTYLLKKLLKLGANLEKPDTVETILATSNFTQAYKRSIINAYKAYTIYQNIQWIKPKTTYTVKEPFLPTDEEVMSLISGCGKTTSILTHLLYETGFRIGEATALKWTDVNFQQNTITMNKPEKGGNARTLEVSTELIARLKTLRKRPDGLIFNPNKKTLGITFSRQRKRISQELQNPRLLEIHFHTFRHLKATNEYYKSKGDLNHVAYILGHKSFNSTQRYAHYRAFRKDEYTTRTIHTQKDFEELLNAGFELITDYGFNKPKVLRKRK
jgi:integrase